MTDLKDKVALVTGASSGIGAGIVKELLQSGMKVVGLARRKVKMEEISKNCASCPGKLFSVETDVTKEEDILKAFAWTRKNVGPIDVLVNCAGVCCRAPATEFEADGLKRTLETNVFALILCTREAIKDMQANKIDGTIVNINSICGYGVITIPNMAAYSASKFAVRGFAEIIRKELKDAGSKIRITNLNPSLVASEMTEQFLSEYPHLQPEDIASGVKYILTQPLNVNVSDLTIRPIVDGLLC